MFDEHMARLSDKRLQHCLRTEARARQMAVIFGIDEQKAAFAGRYHDMMRYLTKEEYLPAADRLGLLYGAEEIAAPILLHGPLAARVMAESGVDDWEILEAVAEHTLARAEMCELSRLIYLADKTEPGRNFPGIKELRPLAEKNLNEAMLLALEYDAKWQEEDGVPFHPQTQAALLWFKQLAAANKGG